MGDFDPTYMDRTRPKGPDYLVADNIFDILSDLTKDDLMAARSEAEELSSYVCG